MKTEPPVLVATRDPDFHADVRSHAHDLPRPHGSRLASGVQLLGSIIGIPLALASGYSIYRTNFSPEATCQSLRASIISMLDKKADASTLRMLVHRDVVTFERDCGQYDPDAVAAFRNLLAAERKPAARHAEPKAEAVVAIPPAKVEMPAKDVPVKREAAKPEPAAKVEPARKAQPAAAAPVKRDEPARAESKPALRLETKAIETPKAALPASPQIDNAAASDKPADAKPAEVKPTEAVQAAAEKAGTSHDTTQVDAAWVASVREALRESAARAQAAAPESDVAAPMPPPIVIDEPPGAAAETPPPPDHPVPPAPIPNAGATPPVH
jgi:hypothetical protein